METNKKDALRRVTLWDDLEKERDPNLEEVEERLKQEPTSNAGPSQRRSLGDKNSERPDLRKGTGTRGSFIGLRMPTGEEILLIVFASMAES